VDTLVVEFFEKVCSGVCRQFSFSIAQNIGVPLQHRQSLVTRSLMRKPDLDYRFYWQMVGPSLTKIVIYFN